MIGNICLEIIYLSVSISFTEVCLAMFHSTRRWQWWCSTNGCVCPLLTVPQLSLCHNMLFKGFSLFTAQQFSCFGSPTSNLSAADGWCSFEMVSQRSRHSDLMYFVYQVTFIYIYSTLYNTYFFKAAFTVMNTNCLCCKIHQL